MMKWGWLPFVIIALAWWGFVIWVIIKVMLHFGVI